MKSSRGLRCCIGGGIFAISVLAMTANAFELKTAGKLYHAGDGTELTVTAQDIPGVNAFESRGTFYLMSSEANGREYKLKVVSRGAQSVTLLQKRKLGAGIYSLWYRPGRKQEAVLVTLNYTVKAPLLTGIEGDVTRPGTKEVTGYYFGMRPPKMWLEYTDPQSGRTRRIRCRIDKKNYRQAEAESNGLEEEGRVLCSNSKAVPPGAGHCQLKCRTRAGEGFAICRVDSGERSQVSAQPGQLIGATHINSLGYDILNVIEALYQLYRSSPSHWSSYLLLIIEYITEDIYFKEIDAYQLVYYTPDPHGVLQKVSGIVFIPKSSEGSAGTFQAPMLSYQHGTMVYRGSSPSLNLLYTEDIFGMIFAQKYGYIVCMADYPGLGINTNQQPYCTETVSQSSADMLVAVTEFLSQHYSGGARWDGELGLIGYSEGGYVTMSLAQRLQEEYAGQFPVSAAAPLDGPYSLSEAMLFVMRQHAPFKEPYFLPLVLNGYDAVYAETTTVFSIFNSVKAAAPGVADGYNTVLYQMVNNQRDSTSKLSEKINQWMAKSMVNPTNYNAPRDILSTEFATLLDDDTSIVVDLLSENDAWRDWIPQMKMKMFHCVEDDLVTVSNTVVAMEGFVSQGADTNTLLQVDYYSIDWLRSFAELFFPTLFETTSVHVLAAPYALVMGVEYVAKEMGINDSDQITFEQYLEMEAIQAETKRTREE